MIGLRKGQSLWTTWVQLVLPHTHHPPTDDTCNDNKGEVRKIPIRESPLVLRRHFFK